MKRIFKAAAWILSITAGILAIVYLLAWKSPPYYEVMNCSAPSIIPFSKYATIIDHPRPMIIKNEKYIVFGSTHTRDPKHPEIKQIETEWKNFQPTVALVEGRLGFLLPGFMDPVKNLGEGGKLKSLAKSWNVKLYNWDLSKKELATQLQKKFTAEQIALAQVLNPYFSSLRFGKPTNTEEFINEFLPRAAFVGKQSHFKSLTDVDRIWIKHFPNGPDWRTVSDEGPLPGFLSDMMFVTNDLRNQQLFCAINNLVKKGERVFVLCGSSHAACVEPALK